VLHAVREHGNNWFPLLQLVFNMARGSRVCREIVVNVSKVRMVRQNQELDIIRCAVFFPGILDDIFASTSALKNLVVTDAPLSCVDAKYFMVLLSVQSSTRSASIFFVSIRL
jgi:hypothetical protein